jgi:hypothetical protein
MKLHRTGLGALLLAVTTLAGIHCGDSDARVTGSSGVAPSPTGTSSGSSTSSSGGLDASSDAARADGGGDADASGSDAATEIGLGKVIFKVDGVDREFIWNATATVADGSFTIRADESADFSAPRIVLRVTQTTPGTFSCAVAGNSVSFRDALVTDAEASATVAGSACNVTVTDVGTAIASPVKGTFGASVVGIATDGGAAFTRVITGGVFNVRRAN